jgi:alginate O-acetyltransferase complex protein AlgI
MAMLAYALQIYGDFSGYSDMGVGLAHLLGYHLTNNFNMPYQSANVSEFWRRWHISLSNWLRDYLFIPLGGSRGGVWRTCRNLLITMTLGGLWHGANWTFILWGVLHGTLLIVHRFFQALCERLPWLQRALRTLPGRTFCVGLTFLSVSLLWVLFREPTMGQAWAFYGSLLGGGQRLAWPVTRTPILVATLALLVCHVLGQKNRWKTIADRLPAPLLAGVYAAMLLVALLLAPGTEKPFIYFQF